MVRPVPTPVPHRAASQLFPPWFRILLLLFVLSGSGGLLAQVCYSKYLVTVVGATAYATSAVLAAFMTGLALGAALGGHLSRRIAKPLAAYGVAELVVAVAVAVGPAAFGALTPAYVALARAVPDSLAALTVARWLLTVAVVLVPTTAMGATLPLLAAGLGEESFRESRLGALYASNTLGGALGALIGAYAVIPSLGLRNSLWTSALCSVVAGSIALVLSRRPTQRPTPQDLPSDAPEASASDSPASPGTQAPSDASNADMRDVRKPETERQGLELPRGLSALALLSGIVVFASEVVFTHLLAVVIGNSAYAFALILAIFLGCLFVGAGLAPRLYRRWPGAALSLGLIAAGLALLATLPLWDDLPVLFADLGHDITTFTGRESVRGAVAFAILCVPTTIMGLTFPLLLQRVARNTAAGAQVGRLTAVNTLGAVVGSLGTGYLMLPWLGSEGTLLALALVLVIAGLLTRRTGFFLAPRPLAIGVIAAAAALFALPRWNPLLLTAGTNVYFDSLREGEKLLFWREDVHGGITTVTLNPRNVRSLYTNGKFQGNTGWEVYAQRSFAHYPSLFVRNFDRALVIGLGTGTTLGTLGAYPWKKLDVVDISPSIVEAARRHFTDVNRKVLEDPRVTVHLDDGRNHLLVDPNKYDLIGMELSSIWFAGAASLYNREFYASVAEHLQPNGVFQQWVQLHHVAPRDFACILETVMAEFESVLLFYGGEQGIIVAANHPLATTAAHLAELDRLPHMAETRPGGRPLEDLLDDVLLTREGLDAWLEQLAQREGYDRTRWAATDDNSYLEYSTPRGNVLPWSDRRRLIADLVRFRDESSHRALLRDEAQL